MPYSRELNWSNRNDDESAFFLLILDKTSSPIVLFGRYVNLYLHSQAFWDGRSCTELRCEITNNEILDAKC
jgi:hypothetical protein